MKKVFTNLVIIVILCSLVLTACTVKAPVKEEDKAGGNVQSGGEQVTIAVWDNFTDPVQLLLTSKSLTPTLRSKKQR